DVYKRQSLVFAQYSPFEREMNQFGGGLGLTWFNGEPYYLFTLNPDISIGKFGIGLDVNLRIDKEGSIRKEDFKSASDYLSLIKYVRYGLKRDPLYVKVGGLDRAILGQGNIISYYNNRASYDNRKIGFEFDWDFNSFGFESMYGDLSGGGILGVRPYIRPFHFSTLKNIPVIGNLTVGLTLARDFNEFSGVTSAKFDTTKKLVKLEDEGNLTIAGIDLLLPVVRTQIFNFDLYSNYTKILKFGSGTTIGTGLSFNFFDLVNLDMRFERWFNKDQYIPRYFDQFYEIQRFTADTSSLLVLSKAQALKGVTSLGNAYYGEMVLDILNFIQIFGAYHKYDKISESGTLHLETDLSPKDGSFVARAFYDKKNIQDNKDILKLDERSIVTAEVGYKPISYILVSIIYQWTFSPERDVNDVVIGYKPQKRVEPRISFVFPLNFGGGSTGR
ncbi:MAG: hypothetical protein N3A61_09970, partial [Ignavibacteria bacterium]|nr:hypothetical protein [Ignavibacteria bacterium]